MTRLIIFTDLHILPEGGHIIGLDPYHRLLNGIWHVNRHHAMAERVICTGDVDAPMTVFGVAEQCGETGAGVETGQAQPIDRPVAAHECRRRAVSYQSVLFNRQSR